MSVEQDEFVPAAALIAVWDKNEDSWSAVFEYLAVACYNILLKLHDGWANCSASEVLVTEITDYVLSYNCIMLEKGAVYSVILIIWKLTILPHRGNVHTTFEDSLRPACTDVEEE